MRHSSIGLTMKVYTHLGIADVAEAVDALPDVTAFSPEPDAEPQTSAPSSPTGSEAEPQTSAPTDEHLVALLVALASGKRCLSQSTPVLPSIQTTPPPEVADALQTHEKTPQERFPEGCVLVEDRGLEPLTSALPVSNETRGSVVSKGVTAPGAGRCTAGCTASPDRENASEAAPYSSADEGVVALARILRSLPAETRVQLARWLLTGGS